MNDTIVAISTALGVGAISIVRVSGTDSINTVNSVFKGKDLRNVESHTINYGHIVDGKTIIDEVLVSVMKGPKTFTTEDIVEINCHGGVATTNRVLELIVSKGIRLAEPGEFTKRAFLNKRIDLAEAEAVMDLIEAKTEKSRQLSINQIDGNLSQLIKKFRQEILEILANIEVNIDYPEYEDIEDFTIQSLKEKMSDIKTRLRNIYEQSKNGRIIKNGIKISIVGKPNVGKSSILNRLINEKKAIVTDVAGTTRDIVEGEVSLNGIMIHFVDTAGLRETDNIVEKIGIERTKQEIATSDLILAVFDSSEEITDESINMINEQKKKTLVVLNKNDRLGCMNQNLKDYEYVSINTIEPDGIEPLKNKIIDIFNIDKIEGNDLTYMSNARQIGIIRETITILEDIEVAIVDNVPIDLIEIDIKRIWEKLGEIIGDTCPDELINQLFSQFCLGK